MPMVSRFFIYGLVDPRNRQLRYVGKSMSGMVRPKSHSYPSRMAENTHKAHWVKSVVASGFKPTIIVLEEFESEDGLNEAEQFYIAYFRFLGCPLTNATEGGEGATGHRASEVTRTKMSEKRRGRKFTSEHKAALSIALQGHSVSDDVRERLSEIHTGNKYCVGRKLSKASRAKMSESVKRTSWIRGKKLSEAVRAKMRLAALKREAEKRQRQVV